jgi:type 1 glutamine amidotransferase
MAVLVFTRTTGFRHLSIPAGVEAFGDLGKAHGFGVEETEDPAAFAELATYAAVVFLSTSGEVLDPEGKAALEAYVRGGGGFVGVHAASTTEYDWPFFGELVGARFSRHPAVQPGTIRVEDREHPATAHLDPVWERTDEWYDFRANPRRHVRVLLTVDESSYDGGGMGDDHPIAWCHPVGGGRSFYTALGHTIESFAEPAFREHLLGGVRYATRS